MRGGGAGRPRFGLPIDRSRAPASCPGSRETSARRRLRSRARRAPAAPRHLGRVDESAHLPALAQQPRVRPRHRRRPWSRGRGRGRGKHECKRRSGGCPFNEARSESSQRALRGRTRKVCRKVCERPRHIEPEKKVLLNLRSTASGARPGDCVQPRSGCAQASWRAPRGASPSRPASAMPAPRTARALSRRTVAARGDMDDSPYSKSPVVSRLDTRDRPQASQSSSASASRPS